MFAFAMPPKAWMRPGPETTRHTPGLEVKQSLSTADQTEQLKKRYRCPPSQPGTCQLPICSMLGFPWKPWWSEERRGKL